MSLRGPRAGADREGMCLLRKLGLLALILGSGLAFAVHAAESFKISVRLDRFTTKGKPPISGSFKNTPVPFLEKKPRAIKKEPVYRGKKQLYGYLDLGNQRNKRFYFVLDQLASGEMGLYFDFNKDGDLTDRKNPLMDMGLRQNMPIGFETRLEIPWQHLIRRSPFEGDFRIWFFLKSIGETDELGHLHFSRTTLTGEKTIGGKQYTVHLVDGPPNDADLTNDGVTFDLDGNGDVDPPQEVGMQSFELGDHEYDVKVSW